MDDGSSTLPILPAIIIIFLLACAAYFAVCETAFASVSRIRLKTAQERGDRRADRAVFVTENFDRAITTILICTNIVHLAAASYVTVLVTRRWGVGAVSVSTVLTTVAVFFAGEMLPKSIGKKYSETLALSTAGSLCFFMRVFTPFSAALTAVGSAAARLTRGESEVTVTEDELYDIIENMTDGGELDETRGELVHSALTFGDVTVESILTARVDLAAIAVDDSPEKILTLIKRERHSRFPVYEGTVDNVIGVLQNRKYIKAYLAAGDAVELRALLDRPCFVHGSTHIDELLRYMSSSKINMAIVSDSYGGTLGVVTVEDILEELVGEIWDEDDEVVEKCVKNLDGSFSFDASVSVSDAFEFMDFADPDEFDFEHKFLGEWAYEQFDFIPAEGESFGYNGLRVTVTEVSSRRIMKLRVEFLPEPEPETEGGAEK